MEEEDDDEEEVFEWSEGFPMANSSGYDGSCGLSNSKKFGASPLSSATTSHEKQLANQETEGAGFHIKEVLPLISESPA
ncbi:hypothetical protein IFR04_010933 [Cadophora malorum]|uniref:Uncharacterized protein n=1 Tax=Cadophora malorum TaxID=108018 RepID=A0A8H7W3K8_9HELO|nr:hypothetical protein IFR04_010933 [Cadophora malorum]